MSAAEELAILVAPLGEEVHGKIERIRNRTGALSSVGEFTGPTREVQAKRAFEKIFDLKNLSVWRTRTLDSSSWRVIYMTEATHAAKMTQADSIVRAAGGRLIDLSGGEYEALRARRWEQMAIGLLQWIKSGKSPEEWGSRMHFDGGAYLYPDGSMRPLDEA